MEWQEMIMLKEYSFITFVLVVILISLASCKGEDKTVNKTDSIELLVQETQKRSKVEKNQEEIQNLVNTISSDLEKDHEFYEIDIKPDYLLFINGEIVLYWTLKDDIVVSSFNKREKKLVDYHIEKDNKNYSKVENMLEKLTNLVK